MKVLVDFHHEELLESLRYLFEERMGWEVYRPIGVDWAHEGFWKIYDHPATIEQYLAVVSLKQETIDHFVNTDNFYWLNKDSEKVGDGVYLIKGTTFPDITYKAIELQTFKDSDFDIMVSSMPDHTHVFEELRLKYHPNAKHIFQIGNNWQAGSAKNVLTSSTVTNLKGKNGVFYHQEFSTDLFSPKYESNPTSLFNMQHYMHDKSGFEYLSNLLPEWKSICYGAGNGGGCPGPNISEVAEVFHNHGWLWHVKSGGEGYGYNIHHAAASGTPMVVKKSLFKGMTAEPLLVDGETCIDLDIHSLPEAAEILRYAAQNYSTWSNNTHARFIEVVDFDKEFQTIKNFLENLI